jgi:hypothetical protein
MTEKNLNITSMEELKANGSDIQLHGDPGAWVCVCKASSKEQGWMKSTKAMQLPQGVLVQVSTQQGKEVAEALTFVPGGKLYIDKKGVCHFTLL